MMADRRYPPREEWHGSPSSDRSIVGRRKIEELQRQIAAMERDMKGRSDLIHKLNRLQEIEREKRVVEERVLERNNSRNSSHNESRNNSRNGTPRLLHSEMQRIIGRESKTGADSPAGVDRHAIETVIKHRTKEFSAKQQEAALKAKYLDKERQRLQEARRLVEEQRLALAQAQSPEVAERLAKTVVKTPKAVESYIKSTVAKLPGTMDKIWKMREDLQQHYNYYKRPYNGELDIGSYEPWQVQDYFVCREIVNDVVEDFLNLYFLHDDVVEKGTYKAMLEEDKLWRDRQTESIAEKRAIHLIAEETILDVTGDMIDEVIREQYHMYRMFGNITDTMLISEAEYGATGKQNPHEPGDRAYNMITKGYFSIKENRNSHRDDIWGHSQYAMNKVKKRKITRKAGGEEVVEEVQEPEDEEEEDIDAPDLTLIDFNTVSRVQYRSLEPAIIDPVEVVKEKDAFRRYMHRELKYWRNMEVTVHELFFNKKTRGLSLVRPSPNHCFIAACTYHGDLMVYDVSVEPWRPFRVVTYDDKKDVPITDLTWSLDSTRIITINNLGRLQVLSLLNGPVSFAAGHKLELPADVNGIYPNQLEVLMTLDTKRGDFHFQQGPLAEEGAQEEEVLVPQRALFFPSLSFLGSQNDIMVSLDNGDLLKCNIQDAIKNINPEQTDNVNDTPRIYRPLLTRVDEATDINTIGNNVEGELLRQHKKGIIYMCFVENLNALVTVDQKGFLYKWKYNSKYKSSFGSFIPSRKYKLETSKVMYKESDSDKPKVIFTDQPQPGKKPRTRQELAAERQKYQNTLDNMQLGDPWYEEINDQEEMIIQIFTPRGVIAETGAMFHIVYRHSETQQLSAYYTKLYKPVKVRCSRIVRVVGSPTSTELIVILLFNAYPPQGPHFTVFIVDLREMTLRDFRKELPVSVQEYNTMMTKTIISCDVTRVLGTSGSDYIFLVFNNRIRCISLFSGQTVVRKGPLPSADDEQEEKEEDTDRFNGCIIDETHLDLPLSTDCTVVSFEGRIHLVLFARKMSKMYIVTFIDKNNYADRRALWKTYTTIPNHQIVPRELRVNTSDWLMDDVQHVSVAARKILLRKMDMEMRKAGLIRDHPRTIKRIMLSDKVENYKILDKTVTERALLDKEAVMQRRAASRAETASPKIDEDDKF